MMLDLRSIARALGGVVSGDCVVAPGPGHSKNDKSLSVSLSSTDPDGFVVNSFAGNDWQDCKDYVRQRLGLDEWQPKMKNGHAAKGKGNGKAEAMPDWNHPKDFPYPDENLAVRYKNVRYPLIYSDGSPALSDKGKPDKTFRQYHLDTKGKWQKGRGDAPAIPYNLPDLIDEIKYANEAGDTPRVLIFEGEGKADIFKDEMWPGSNGLSVAATSIPKGAKDYGKYFAGADVWIVPDNDEPGGKYREEVAAEITPHAKSVLVVELPELGDKEDVGDWLPKHGMPKFFAEVEKAREWRAPGAEEPDSAPPAGESVDVVAEMNGIYATVSVAGKFRVMTFSPDKSYSRQSVATFSTKTDFLNHVIHPKILVTEKNDEGEAKQVKKPRGQYWIGHPNRRQYDDIDFVPGGPAIIEVRTARRIIRRHNMWSGFSVEPREGDCGLYLAHLFDHVCRENQEAYDYLLGWMASGVQEPSNPGRTCISLRGLPGTGKGITAREYGKLFGRHFMPLNHREHITGKFNAHTAETTLLFADEALFVGDMRDADILKYLVSEEDKMLERKGIDAVRIRNYARLIVASNHDHVLRIEVHDRRYCALHVVLPNDMVGPEGADNRRVYFGAIAHQMETGGRAALLHMLQNMDITGFNPERVPQTEELDKQKLLSASPADQAVIALASDGHLPGALASRPYIAYSRKNQSHDGLYDFMRRAGGRGLDRASDNELADILKSWGFVNKKLSDGNAWAAPDLSKLRTGLGQKYPAVTWDDASMWGSIDGDG